MTEATTVSPEVINEDVIKEIVQIGDRLIVAKGEPEFTVGELHQQFLQSRGKSIPGGLGDSDPFSPSRLRAEFPLTDGSELVITKPTEKINKRAQWFLRINIWPTKSEFKTRPPSDIHVYKDGAIEHSSFMNGISHYSDPGEEIEEGGGASYPEPVPNTLPLTSEQAEQLADWLREFEKSPSTLTRLWFGKRD